MAEVTYQRFDASRYLDTPQSAEEYLSLALDEADAKTIQLVQRDIENVNASKR